MLRLIRISLLLACLSLLIVMYVTHHYMDVMPETARKRTLEEADDAIHGITSFGEHRNVSRNPTLNPRR